MRYQDYDNGGQLHSDLVHILPYARKLAAKNSPERGRELSLVVTKLEEALLWTKAHIRKNERKLETDDWDPGWWK
jgi:hypothetical protein